MSSLLLKLDPIDIGFVFFCLFVGAGYRLFVSPKTPQSLTLVARIYTQLCAVLVLGIISLFLMVNKHCDTFIVGLCGFICCLGAGRIIQLLAEWIDKFDSLSDLLTGLIGLMGQVTKLISKIGTASRAFLTEFNKPKENES